jgi:DNA repair protein RadC
MMATQLDLFPPGNLGAMTNAELIGVACGQDPRNVEHLVSDGIGAAATRAVGDVRLSIELALELARRINADCALREVRQVRSAQDVARPVEHRLRGLDQEELCVVLLSTRNHVVGMEQIYKGSISTAIVRPSEVFKPAIVASAASIVVAHNHPSGDPTPSADDVRVTRDLVAAGKLLDIDLLDHLVIGDERHGYVSLRERRLAFD